jgi:xanthine dehydrogenase accessory factor
LVSIQPEELMADAEASLSEAAPLHVQARNMCPSKGSMDVFVEPMLSNPELWVVGGSPVAQALAELAPVFDFDVNRVDPGEVGGQLQTGHLNRYVVIATQGSGDLKALIAALSVSAQYIGFVGSSRKIAHLKTKLEKQNIDEQQLECIHCPAGLDINAVTPQEIALSIIADLVRRRRA